VSTGRAVVVAVRGAGKHRAVRWAAAEARRRGVDLEVLVGDDAPDHEPEPGSTFARALDAIRQAVPGLAVSAHPADTGTAPALQRRSIDAGLVVVPADLPELELVVAGSYCPVVVVPERATTPGAPVVVGVVPWTGEDTIELAFSAAAALRAKLVAVRAWDDPSIDLGLLRPDRIAAWDRAAERARTELELAVSAARVVHPDVPVELVVVQDRPADLLLAMSSRAQVLVLGRSERGALLAGVAGSPVGTVLRAHWCPVVVVPPGGPPRTTWLPSRSRGWAISNL
jgi:nucleotide-binding universal stress UspA family protein